MIMYNKIIDVLRQCIYHIVDPLIKGLASMGVTPNMITFFGFLLNVAASIVFVKDNAGLGGLLMLVAGLFDMMDGRMARITHQESRFGAVWDSTLDRYSEMFCLFGITFFFLQEWKFNTAIVTFVAMIGSVMVSYVRARAEGMDIECKVGVMQRTERVVLLALGAILTGVSGELVCLTIAVWVIAIGANLTAFRRLWHCRKMTKR